MRNVVVSKLKTLSHAFALFSLVLSASSGLLQADQAGLEDSSILNPSAGVTTQDQLAQAVETLENLLNRAVRPDAPESCDPADLGLSSSELDEIRRCVCIIKNSVDVIESKVCNIDSKIDNLAMEVDIELDDEFAAVCSKIESLALWCEGDYEMTQGVYNMSQGMQNQMGGVPAQLDVIQSKVCDVDSKVDDVDDVLSKVCAIDSKLDNLELGGLDGIQSKLDVLDACCCDPVVINEAGFVIEEPGTYIVGKDLTRDTDKAVIFITAEGGVVLDLCGKKLSGSVSGVTGILVADDVSNVTIKNGLVSDCDCGIKVEEGCSNITIDNVDITECEYRAIDFVGTSGAGNIVNSEIKNCRIVENLRTITSLRGEDSGEGAVVLLNNCSSVKMSNCQVNNNGNDDIRGPSSIIRLVDCSKCELNSVDADCNESKTGSDGVLSVFTLRNSSNNLIEQCSAVQNKSGDEGAIGFKIENDSNNNIIKECRAIANIGGVAIGFFVARSQENIYLDCIASNNKGSNEPGSRGFFLSGADRTQLIRCNAVDNDLHGFQLSGSDTCIFEDCQSLNNDFHGFRLDRSDECILKCCQALKNGTADSADGFKITDCTKCEIKDCQALNNSFHGFHDDENSTNLYIRNIACDNTVANYFNIPSTKGAPVSSPADARGVDNVDCALTDADSVDVIESKVCDIESKICVLDGKIDELLEICGGIVG